MVKALEAKVRAIPDFPKPGIVFRDITPLVADPSALKLAVSELIAPFRGDSLDAVAGMEARGFIFGSIAAWELGVAFVPLRKPGKLPYEVRTETYELEYGAATLEIHTDAVKPGDRVLLMDDLIATGGTAAASCQLLEKVGAEVVGCAFLIELDALKGRDRLAHRHVHTLLHF